MRYIDAATALVITNENALERDNQNKVNIRNRIGNAIREAAQRCEYETDLSFPAKDSEFVTTETKVLARLGYKCTIKDGVISRDKIEKKIVIITIDWKDVQC